MMEEARRYGHFGNTYLSSFFILIAACCVSAQINTVTFHLKEKESYGTYVGSVAVQSDIQRNITRDVFASLTYEFFEDPNSQNTGSLFTINRKNGVIHTAAMIDREELTINGKKVCVFVQVCEIEFDVTVKSSNTTFLRFIPVRIIIDDINDSPPTFTPSEIQISVSESINAGSKIPIEGATDKDTAGENSIQSYEITSYKDMFDVEFEGKLDGSSSLKLVVLRGLDREKRDRYQFRILARDGGNPPLTGTLTVNVHVIDVNDNAPMFVKQHYSFNVQETTTVNSVIGRVAAKDRDAGKNARVLYRFSTLRPSKLEELFTLDEASGELIVRSPLQYEAGNTYETVIEAVDKGETPQASQATLAITILDVGNTPPKITLTLTSTLYDDTIYLSEWAPPRTTFVGRAKVEDNDSGKNGEVHCSSLDDHFSVDELGGNSYAIRLQKELDRETQNRHNVTIMCVDSGVPSLSSRASFIVQVKDENDNSPIFLTPIYQANVSENNNRTVRLVTVKATDADLGENGRISYYLSLNAGAEFSIDRDRGIIRSHGAFDREAVSKITFLVKAVDNGKDHRTGTATVNINIEDVNDNRPYFPPTPVKFYIPENMPSGKNVGQLTARDRDIGVNAALQYKTQSNDPSIPFVVFSDGVIRTERELDREVKDKYVLDVSVTDNGQPPLYSNGTVTIIVQDMNDHSPTISFPNEDNNTIMVYSDTEPGTRITTVIATDEDLNDNGRVTYMITGGNRGNAFAIGRSTGELHLTRHLTLNDEKKYRLTISVQDCGIPQQEAQTLLNIDIFFTNTTIAASLNAKDDAYKYIVIAGCVAGVTVILSIFIVSIILYIRRNDNMRRDAEEKTGVQEECGKRELERRIWQEVSTEEIKAGFEKPEKGDNIYKSKMDKDRSFTIDPDRNVGDSFLSHAALDQFGKPDFFTFRKSHAPFSEDVRSDASGETTTSDSGRGGSEEDIQLPLPDLKGYNGSHQIFSVAIDENEEFLPQSTPLELREKSKTLSTFSNPSMANRIAMPTTSSFRDIHSCNDPNFRNNQRNQHKVRFNTEGRNSGHRGNGKQVKFPKEFNGRTNVPVISHGDIPLKHMDQAAFSYLGSYNSLPRSVDDDDNTTTSGSYTLNPEDFEEVFCER